MKAQTREPLRIVRMEGGRQVAIVNQWGGLICYLDIASQDFARRIVACVNACVGISTDHLIHGDAAPMQRTVDALRARVAELESALEPATRVLDLDFDARVTLMHSARAVLERKP